MIKELFFLFATVIGVKIHRYDSYCDWSECGKKTPMCYFSKYRGPRCYPLYRLQDPNGSFRFTLTLFFQDMRRKYASLCNVSNMNFVEFDFELNTIAQTISNQCFLPGEEHKLAEICLKRRDGMPFSIIHKTVNGLNDDYRLLYDMFHPIYSRLSPCLKDGRYQKNPSVEEDIFYKLLFATTREIGWGYSQYRVNDRNYTNLFILLAPAPTAEKCGDAVYLVGPPCSRCPTGRKNCIGNICGYKCNLPPEEILSNARRAHARISKRTAVLALLIKYFYRLQ